MTETFIESAMMALSGAWNNDTVNVNCQPLTDALHAVASVVSGLRYDVSSLQDSMDSMKNQNAALEHELSVFRNRSSEMELKLAMLTTDTHGFVQRPELLERLSVVRGDFSSAIRNEADKLLSQIDQLRTQQHETAILAVRNRDSLDALIDESSANTARFKVAVGEVDNFAKVKTSEHAAMIDAQNRALRELQKNLDSAIKSAAQRTSELVQLTRDDVSRDINSASADVLIHLQDQAAQIDDLRRRHDERTAAVPSRADVATLVQSMEKSRASLDEAQFRLSETFSQCMALVGNTAAAGSAISGLSTGVGTQMATTNSAARILASLKPSAGASSLLGQVPAGVEVQLDSVRHQLKNVQEEVIPGCTKEIGHLSAEVHTLVSAIRRVDDLTASLVECLGWGDGDELRASLLAHDHHKTIVLLRKGFAVLASNKFTLHGDVDDKRNASISTSDRHPQGDTTSNKSRRPDSISETPSRLLSMVDPKPSQVAAVWKKKDDSQTDTIVEAAASKFRCPPLGLDLADSVGSALGANVMLVTRDSIADIHGLRAGDRIIKVGGSRCDNCSDFVNLLAVSTRRAVINHYAQGLTESELPSLQVDVTVIPSRSSATRHVQLTTRLVRTLTD